MGGNMYPEQSTINEGIPLESYDDVERAIIIKWSVFCGIFLVIALWIVIGIIHARRRLQRGQPLLFYHRVSDVRSLNYSLTLNVVSGIFFTCTSSIHVECVYYASSNQLWWPCPASASIRHDTTATTKLPTSWEGIRYRQSAGARAVSSSARAASYHIQEADLVESLQVWSFQEVVK